MNALYEVVFSRYFWIISGLAILAFPFYAMYMAFVRVLAIRATQEVIKD
jgi:hypothetical protein